MKDKKIKPIKKDSALAAYDDKTLEALTNHIVRQMSLLAIGQKWSQRSAATLPVSSTDITLLSQGIGGSPTSGTITMQNLADQMAILGQYLVLSGNALSARGSTTANLLATYANGSSGVGATLTANSPGALIIDGIGYVSGDYILVNNQTSAFQNGLYVVTFSGTISSVYQLTRATSMNKPYQFIDGRLIYLDSGTTQAKRLLALINNSSPFIVGTSPVSFGLVASNAVQIYGRALSSVAPTDGQVLAWNNSGGTWEPTSFSVSLPFVTIGSGGTYPNIGAALTAGYKRWWAVGNFSEPANIQLTDSDDYSMICNQGVTATFNDVSIIYNNSICNLYWNGGAINWAMTISPGNFIQYLGVGKGNYLFENCTVQEFSTQVGSYFNDNAAGGTLQVFKNVNYLCANISGCGPRIAGGITSGLRMTGGGSSCDNILTVNAADINGLILTGSFSSSTVLQFGDCTIDDVYIGSNSGTPLARVNIYDNCSIENMVAKADAGWRIVPLGGSIKINNLTTGALGSFFTGSGSSEILVSNSEIKDMSFTISPAAPIFTNCKFTQTSDMTIQSDAAIISNCKFYCNVILDADFITLNTPLVGDTHLGSLTITVNAVNQCFINAPITEADIVDGGTNTSIVSPRKW